MSGTLSRPMSALELCNAVRLALPCDASQLDRILCVDESRGLVEVQAGTPWKTIASRLRPGDAQAAAVPARTQPTVGESIARNAAGPDGRPAVTHVESLALVTPDGQLRRINRLADSELFALAIGGQGLFGVPYSITLRLETLARAISEAAPVETLQAPRSGLPARPLTLLVPPDRLAQFLDDANSRCDEWRTAVKAAEIRPILTEGETFLRWAPRDYAAVTLWFAAPGALGGAVRDTQLRRVLLDAAIGCGGSFPVACTPEATREQTVACYPQLPGFLAHKRRLDPAERLVNPWYRHYSRLLGRESCEVRFGAAA
jgi:FAD binding domain-containing protein